MIYFHNRAEKNGKTVQSCMILANSVIKSKQFPHGIKRPPMGAREKEKEKEGGRKGCHVTRAVTNDIA